MDNRTYIAIDLKSFYASVECMERGLNPMTTNLVVADAARSPKTICLAVSPSLKSFGIPGRPRLFEVVQKVAFANAERKRQLCGGNFSGESVDINELNDNANLSIGYVVAVPQMAKYVEISAQIYQVYLKYIAPEDIHVYSIDEVFMDVTAYLKTYKMSAHDLAMTIIRDVLNTTGITATAGIGTNMYLAKIAMDIVAKKMPADKDGVRIAELDEMTYRRQLWEHKPLVSFWRVGKGIAAKLEKYGMFTMGDVARMSLSRSGEDLLYKQLGVNAELLIDHAWGWEPCTMADIKAYKPASNSICSGQVLQSPYDHEKARLVVREMTDLLAFDLIEKNLVTDQLVLTVGYDVENLTDPARRSQYKGQITIDTYGRKIPKHAHGTANIGCQTSSARRLIDTVTALYDRIVDPALLVRRVSISANHLVDEKTMAKRSPVEQLDLFADYETIQREREKEEAALEKEKKIQHTLLSIKKKFGKNAVLKGVNLEDGATTQERNNQIGGHKA